MYRPSLKSGWSLILLFAFSVILFIIARVSYVTIKTDDYEMKVQAAKYTLALMDTLKAEQNRLGIPFDPINDPYQTGLIGVARSTITTDRGLLSEKQVALNPNLAAAFVQEFSKANLKAGDHIAVGMTGSNPAVNLALYGAIKAMKLKPTIVVALSSASYGANQEEYTWLDMEAILKRKGLIDFGCTHASLGGKDDLAVGLSPDGITALSSAMERNNVTLLSGASLDEMIASRLEFYTSNLPNGERYKLFVNIGRGLANVGSEPNANQIPEGLNRKLAEEEFPPPEGVIMKMAKEGVTILSYQHFQRMVKRYKLQNDTPEMAKPGVGPAFSMKKHNVLIASICLFLLAAAIIAVIILDRHDRHFMANIVDPDEEL